MESQHYIRQDLTQALVAIVSQGIQNNQLDDAENIINALKILCPQWSLIDEFQPYIAIKRGNFREALQMYTSMPSENSKWYAMTALCLKLAGDPTWHGHASLALEKNDATAQCAHGLARVLLGMLPADDFGPISEPTDQQSLSAAVDIQDLTLAYNNYLAV